jgi:hypothetical protein
MNQAVLQRSVYDPTSTTHDRGHAGRNLSPHTQRAYTENVAQFARYFRRSPAHLGPDEIRTYQVYLTRERKLAPSSLEIAVCALRFLYKVTLKKPWAFDDLIPAPKKPQRLPVVLGCGRRRSTARSATWRTHGSSTSGSRAGARTTCRGGFIA